MIGGITNDTRLIAVKGSTLNGRLGFCSVARRAGRGVEVEFRLVYDGKLSAASRTESRNREKDRIRRVLSKQLKEL